MGFGVLTNTPMRYKDEGGASADVRFGSKADIEARPRIVRFTPESRH
jgi:hypothetical protein